MPVDVSTLPGNLFGGGSVTTGFNGTQIILLVLLVALLLGIVFVLYMLYLRFIKYNIEVEIKNLRGGLEQNTEVIKSGVIPLMITYDVGYHRKNKAGADEFFLVGAKKVLPQIDQKFFYPQKKFFRKLKLTLYHDGQNDYHPVPFLSTPAGKTSEQPNYQEVIFWHTTRNKYFDNEFRDKPTLWQLYGGVILSFIPFAIVFVMVLIMMNKMDGWIEVGAQSNNLIAQALTTIKGG